MAYKLKPKERARYNHYFGGNTWKMPICENCKKPYQQLITLDLRDPRLEEFKDFGLSELPLMSCLNCSSWWGHQCFQLDPDKKEVKFISNTDEWHEKIEYDTSFEVPFDIIPLELKRINKSDAFEEEEIPDIFKTVGEDYIITVGEKPMLYDCDLEEIGDTCSICGSAIKYVAMLASEMAELGESLDEYDKPGDYSKVRMLYFGDEMLFFFYCSTCKTIHVYAMS